MDEQEVEIVETKPDIKLLEVKSVVLQPTSPHLSKLNQVVRFSISSPIKKKSAIRRHYKKEYEELLSKQVSHDNYWISQLSSLKSEIKQLKSENLVLKSQILHNTAVSDSKNIIVVHHSPTECQNCHSEYLNILNKIF